MRGRRGISNHTLRSCTQSVVCGVRVSVPVPVCVGVCLSVYVSVSVSVCVCVCANPGVGCANRKRLLARFDALEAAVRSKL